MRLILGFPDSTTSIIGITHIPLTKEFLECIIYQGIL